MKTLHHYAPPLAPAVESPPVAAAPKKGGAPKAAPQAGQDLPKGNGLYIYCVTGSSFPLPSCKHPTYSITCGSLSALVGEVPLEDFAPQTMAAHQGDLPWLEEKVKHHNEVIFHAMRHTTALPMRFGTIFSSRQAVLDFLGEHSPLFTRLLERFEGRHEWGAKLFSRARASAPGASQAVPQASPGRSYLLRKGHQRLANDKTNSEAIAKAAELHHALSHNAVRSLINSRVFSPHDGSDPTPIFSASYLVDADRLPQFLKAADDFSAATPPSFQVNISGPWPPYSFVSPVDASQPLPEETWRASSASANDPLLDCAEVNKDV